MGKKIWLRTERQQNQGPESQTRQEVRTRDQKARTRDQTVRITDQTVEIGRQVVRPGSQFMDQVFRNRRPGSQRIQEPGIRNKAPGSQIRNKPEKRKSFN